ncbi:Flagellar brake protein YcgR 2 (fragment) [Burkholderia sp. 8Y]
MREAHFVFDVSSMQRLNRALAGAAELTFRSQPSGVRTGCVTGRAVETTFEGRPALQAPFPELLHYVQRREYYRVDAPLLDAFVLSGNDHAGVAFRYELQDLSLGGVSLRAREAHFESLTPGTILKDVRLQAGGLGAVLVDLQIVAPRPVLAPTGQCRTVLGCRFVELKGNAERVLQRAILQLEMRHGARAARL